MTRILGKTEKEILKNDGTFCSKVVEWRQWPQLVHWYLKINVYIPDAKDVFRTTMLEFQLQTVKDSIRQNDCNSEVTEALATVFSRSPPCIFNNRSKRQRTRDIPSRKYEFCWKY